MVTFKVFAAIINLRSKVISEALCLMAQSLAGLPASAGFMRLRRIYPIPNRSLAPGFLNPASGGKTTFQDRLNPYLLGQDLYDVFHKTFVDFPMPRNRLFLACYRVHVQVMPRAGTHKNTTRFD
jgi:hypothetical protein